MQVVCLGVIPFVLYKLLLKGDLKAYARDTWIKPKINPLCYFIAFVLGLLVFLLNLIFSNIIQNFLISIGFTYVSGVQTIFSSPEVLIMQIITVAVLPAVFEEIVDRGLLLSALENEKNESKKIFLVGLLFGLMHQNITQFATTMLVGFLLAYIAIKCKSIIPAIIVHFLNNFLIVMIGFSDQRTGWFMGVLNSFLAFAYSNFMLLLFMIAVLTGLLFALMYLFKSATINDKVGRRKEEGGSVDINNTNTIHDSRFTIHEKTVNSKFDLAFIYLSIALSAATTIFTFVWGVLR
jgi:membrane protease YdiL (CAAX protease family)